jgi:CheY-like chemotaxis protein
MSKILVVDDEPQVRNMLKDLLEDEGYSVTIAQNGVEVLRACQTEMPDLIITDLIMPEKEGIEFIREIKRERPGIKIIAISGGGRIGPHNYLKYAERFGAEFAFKKPVASLELLNAVNQLLQ